MTQATATTPTADPKAYSDVVRVWTAEEHKVEGKVTVKWEQQPADGKLSTLCQAQPHSFDGYQIIFLETPPDKLGGQELVTKAFGVPSAFWEKIYQDANGYFAPYETRGEGNELVRFDTEFRLLCKKNKSNGKGVVKEFAGISYVWEKLAFYTSWRKGSLTILCFDLPPELEASLMKKLKAAVTRIDPQPLEHQHHLVEVMVENFDTAVWQWRDLVRELEQARPESPLKGKPDYIRMHELSRHLTHNTEGVTTAIEVVEQVQQALQRLDQQRSAKIVTNQGLIKQRSMLAMTQNRSKALEARLTSEITLVYQIIQQWDSDFSYSIARIAAQDSSTTRVIAFLGLVFLPGTLISAIFSTSFFNFSPDADRSDTWRVSEKFWIYWAITLPVTITVLIGWYIWQYRTQLSDRWSKTALALAASRAPETDTALPVPGPDRVRTISIQMLRLGRKP